MRARLPGALWRHFLSRVDIASVVVFRVAFGLLMVWEVWRYWSRGWIESLYTAPALHFPYPGFSWIGPWPGPGMEVHFAVLALLALGIALGAAYRACCVLFFFGFAYVFLLEQARYLNHFYLIGLLSLLLAFVPAHRSFSVDARLRPTLASDQIPAWSLDLLRTQLAIVYLFAAIAKVNGDWLHGWPLRIWLSERAETSWLGPLLELPLTALVASYTGFLFDLLVVPLLLWKPTRRYAFGGAVLFHLGNGYLFQIGIFPFLAIAATTLFLDPAWPRRFLARRGGEARIETPPPKALRFAWGWAGVAAIFFSLQLALPLRHGLYPGPVAWTEEGHAFSWRMKLRDKEGRCRFWVRDESTGETWWVDPRRHVAGWQYRRLCGNPAMIRHFVAYLAGTLRNTKPNARPAVGVDTRVSLNGRPPRRLLDPDANLVAWQGRLPFEALRSARPPIAATRWGFAAPKRQ